MNMGNVTPTVGAEQLRDRWGWYLALGISLTILGIIAFSATVFVTLISVILLGILVLIGGVMQIVSAFRAQGFWGIVFRVILGILFLLAGWYLITRPAIGAITLTLVMAWFFIITGIVQIVTAVVEKFEGWGWTIAGGVAGLVLGILLLIGWPVTGLYAIGLFLAIDLVISGISWIIAAFAARRYTPPSAAAPAA